MQTRIKFCGMTRQSDVQYAISLGVDALGFVFVKGSPRNLDIDKARDLLELIPPFIVKVGLFMNSDVSEVLNVVNKLRVNLLQFHGDEDEVFCNQFDYPYLKAVPMGNTNSVSDFCSKFSTATGFVLDSHQSGQMGGSGVKFAWDSIPSKLNKPIILAGGLTPENVAEAIRIVQPYAVDVSSGIEASKGIKDPVRMDKFVKEVKNG